MSIVRQPKGHDSSPTISPAELKNAEFDNYGVWIKNYRIHDHIYRFMIIRDGEGLFTIAMTPIGHTVEVIEHAVSLPEAIQCADTLLQQVYRHDITVINVGERLRVIA